VIYGATELLYAEPFAKALVEMPEFRVWSLGKSKFRSCANQVRLLHREMLARRSKSAKYWWRSYYTEACRCFGCSGQETDLLAIFETSHALRVAIHFEGKHPRDVFKKPNQAAAYPERAKCWAAQGNTPKKVLPHDDAGTALICSKSKLTEYGPHLRYFDSIFTFEEIAEKFPAISFG